MVFETYSVEARRTLRPTKSDMTPAIRRGYPTLHKSSQSVDRHRPQRCATVNGSAKNTRSLAHCSVHTAQAKSRNRLPIPTLSDCGFACTNFKLLDTARQRGRLSACPNRCCWPPGQTPASKSAPLEICLLPPKHGDPNQRKDVFDS